MNEPNYIDIATFVVILLGFVGALFQLRLLRKQVYAEHDWNRRNKALNYAFTDDPHITSVLSRLDKHLNLGKRPKSRTISIEEIEELANGEYRDIRSDIQFVLGRFENMFVAVKHSIADQAVCKEMVSSRVILYHHFFKEYIDDVRVRVGSNRIYENFEAYASEWSRVVPLDSPRPRVEDQH